MSNLENIIRFMSRCSMTLLVLVAVTWNGWASEPTTAHHFPDSVMIYYPVPLHLQKAYQDPRYHQGDFAVAERLAACVLSLPMHTELDEEQLEYITKAVKGV